MSIRMRSLCVLPVLLAMHGAFATCPDLAVVAGNNNPPLNAQVAGKLEGLGVEVVRILLQRSGCRATPVALPWSRALQQGLNRPDTLLFTMAMTEERKPLFHWIGPVAPREVWLWKLKRRTDIVIRGKDDIPAYRVGETPFDAGIPALAALGMVEGTNLDIATRDEDNGRKLLAGRIDLVANSPQAIPAFARKAGIPVSDLEAVYPLISRDGYYLAFSRQTRPATITQFRQAFASLVRDGTLQHLQARWLASAPGAR